MITNENVVSISQIRKETDAVLKKIDRFDRPYYLFSRSQIKAVLINPNEFAKMQQIVEDYLDQQELLKITGDELKTGRDFKKVKPEIVK